MGTRSDGSTGPEGRDALRALDGPADEDLEFTGPGDVAPHGIDAYPDPSLPGGLDHTTAAVGAGSVGLVLLGVAGIFKRRRNRRFEALAD